MFYALKFHILYRKQTLIGSKYLSPYLNSIFSPFVFYQKWSKSSNLYNLRRRFLRRSYRDINKLISILHMLISGHHSNNRVTESDEKLNEIRKLAEQIPTHNLSIL